MQLTVRYKNGTLIDDNGESPIEFKQIKKNQVSEYLHSLYGESECWPWFPKYKKLSAVIAV